MVQRSICRLAWLERLHMGLTKQSYTTISDTFERSLNAGVKKESGVFYTDLPLAEKMLSELGLHPGAVVMDPCCGTGVFLYAAQQHGLQQLYGVDCDPKVIDFCRQHLPGIVFTTADSIGPPAPSVLRAAGLSVQPDAVIGNPPFVSAAGGAALSSDSAFRSRVGQCGGNLFVAALLRAFELVRPGGVISYIVPKNVLHVAGYRALRRHLLSEKTILSIIDLGAYFKNVRGEQIVLTLRNCPPAPGHTIQLKRLMNDRFAYLCSIGQSVYEDEILLFDSATDLAIYRKLSAGFPPLGQRFSGIARGKCSGAHAVAGKNIRKFGYKDRALPQTGNRVFVQNIYSSESGVIAAYGGELDAAQTVTVVPCADVSECRYLLGLLHSRVCNLFLYKYCYNSSRLTMHTDAAYLGKLPLPPVGPEGRDFERIVGLVARLESGIYMSEDWFGCLEQLDQAVYAAYHLTQEEAAAIDRETEKIQSRRWLAGGRHKTLQ